MAALFHKKQKSPIRSPRSNDDDESTAFRRSRTLTGSSSEHVTSVSESRAQIKSPRLKEHELRKHRKKLSGYLIVIVAVILGIIFLLSQFIGVIAPRIVSSQPINGTPDTQIYLKAINNYFWDHPTERFRFVLNKASLDTYLAAHIPEVDSVTFEQTGLALATVDIQLRVPIVAWELQAKKYYVDAAGRAFERNFYPAPAVTVKDNSGLSDASSGAIVSNRFLESMGRVVALTKISGIVITGATLPRNTTREIDFNLEGRGYIIKAQLGRDPASQATDIVNAVKYVDSAGIKPGYVDVRVSSQAAYQ